jgi:hypothetical protein
MRSAIISGASRYITGSDVYGSNTDCIGPNPNAAIHVAMPADRVDSPEHETQAAERDRRGGVGQHGVGSPLHQRRARADVR